MATRQYIGARYVPIFFNQNGSNEWVNGIAYESLTIVTYLGNSYTSTKSVPSNIGNPADNPEYWVNTGNFNSQLNNALAEINNLKITTNRLANKKIIMIGDSYGTGHVDDLTYTPYPYWIQKYLGLDNNNFKTSFQNGAGFGNGLFLSQLNSFEDDADITDVYVFGGWNDIGLRYSNEVVQSNMRTFGNIAKQKFPNATLYLGLVGYGYDISSTVQNYFKILNETTYGQCSIYGGFIYLKSYMSAVQAIPTFWADINTSQGATHPSTVGSIYIAYRLVSCMLTGSVTQSFSHTSNIEIYNDNTTTANGTFTQKTDGSIVVSYFSNFDFACNSITIPSTHSNRIGINIGTVPETITCGMSNQTFFYCDIFYATSTAIQQHANGLITISGHTISISSLSGELTDVKHIYLTCPNPIIEKPF